MDRSLARWADEERKAILLHDLQHDYLRKVNGDRLSERHARLLRACATRLGAAALMEKPVDIQLLSRKLEEVCRASGRKRPQDGSQG